MNTMYLSRKPLTNARIDTTIVIHITFCAYRRVCVFLGFLY